MAVDMHMRGQYDADREAAVGWLRKRTAFEIVEPESGHVILRIDEAQDDNAATVHASVLINGMSSENCAQPFVAHSHDDSDYLTPRNRGRSRPARRSRWRFESGVLVSMSADPRLVGEEAE